jgi:hypothetical protein
MEYVHRIEISRRLRTTLRSFLEQLKRVELALRYMMSGLQIRVICLAADLHMVLACFVYCKVWCNAPCASHRGWRRTRGGRS